MSQPTTYKELAGRTESCVEDADLVGERLRSNIPGGHRMLHALLGLGTEIGELQDIAKRALYYGSSPDPHALAEMRKKIIEECGDVEWYLAIIYRVLDVSQNTVQRLNILKLRKRYSDKFTEREAYGRDVHEEAKTFDDELAAMQAAGLHGS